MDANPVILHFWPEADGLPSSSPYCLKVVYAARFKEIPYRLEYAIHHLPDWMKRGKLPVAEIGVKKLEDSSNILRELDRLGGPLLYPADPAARADAILLEEWADEILTPHMVFSRWANPEHFAKFGPQAFRFAREDRRQSFVDAALDYHLTLFRERGLLDASADERLERFSEAVGILEQKLLRNPFLVAAEPTAADFSAFPSLQIAFAGRLGELTSVIDAHPSVLDWMKRMTDQTKEPL